LIGTPHCASRTPTFDQPRSGAVSNFSTSLRSSACSRRNHLWKLRGLKAEAPECAQKTQWPRDPVVKAHRYFSACPAARGEHSVAILDVLKACRKIGKAFVSDFWPQRARKKGPASVWHVVGFLGMAHFGPICSSPTVRTTGRKRRQRRVEYNIHGFSCKPEGLAIPLMGI
jgi:hypothetical protein